jgi:hypothetical protein
MRQSQSRIYTYVFRTIHVNIIVLWRGSWHIPSLVVPRKQSMWQIADSAQSNKDMNWPNPCPSSYSRNHHFFNVHMHWNMGFRQSHEPSWFNPPVSLSQSTTRSSAS